MTADNPYDFPGGPMEYPEDYDDPEEEDPVGVDEPEDELPLVGFEEAAKEPKP